MGIDGKQGSSSRLDKRAFLGKPEITSFVAYLSKVLTGRKKIDHSYDLSRSPKSSVSAIYMDVLEDGYKQYRWRRRSYAETASQLEEIRASFNTRSTTLSRDQIYFDAIEKCLAWGLGGKAKSDNLNWAKQRKKEGNLSDRIRLGVRLLNSDNPDLAPFENEVRMNAGYTKVYSLLSKNSIIYDGRVGAALGYLVLRFLSETDETAQARLFRELSFPYGRGNGANARNRNPSTIDWKFPSLGQDSLEHAKWNLRANWIIEAAIEIATRKKCSWVSSDDALRRVEAALFMVGYEVPSSQ